MKLFRMVILVGLAAMFLAGCGGGPPKEVINKPDSCIPDWFMVPPTDPNYIFAAASGDSRDMQLAIDKATTNARQKTAEQVEIKVKGLTKNFMEEAGTGEDTEIVGLFSQVTKQVSSQVLVGSRVDKQEICPQGSMYKAFVLMELPIGEAAAGLMKGIKSDHKLYDRFRASQAFEELDKEVEDYEKFKEEQGF